MLFIKNKFIIGELIILFGLVIFTLEYFGFIWHNYFFARHFSVKGLDISHYQNDIDWTRVAATKNYSFVFIKATEGHDFIDDKFATNWQQARANGFLVGAYHFFSTRSSGKDQAKYFIATVPQADSALPPVIDIEIDTNKNPDLIRRELTDLITELTNYYHRSPILYLTYDTYNAYIKGYFTNNHLWVRDVLQSPQLTDRPWLFWQFHHRGHVSGINTYVDINAFRGTFSELQQLTYIR